MESRARFFSWTPPWNIFPRQKKIQNVTFGTKRILSWQSSKQTLQDETSKRAYGVTVWGGENPPWKKCRWSKMEFYAIYVAGGERTWWLCILEKLSCEMIDLKKCLQQSWPKPYPHIGSNCIFFCARCRTKTAVVVKSSHTKPPQLPVLFAWKWKVRYKYKSR